MLKPRIKLYRSLDPIPDPFMKWSCKKRGTTSGYGTTPKNAYISWRFNNPWMHNVLAQTD